MDNFPPLEKWFEIRERNSERFRYIRFDLCLRNDLGDDDKAALVDEIVLLIARLRLTPSEYQKWLDYRNTGEEIPEDWKLRFKHRFWKSFVSQSATNRHDGEIKYDDTALQGHLGELILYLVQHQIYGDNLIEVEPPQPKNYSKSDGIDCLEIIGSSDNKASTVEPSYYIVWEAKGLESSSMGNYPTKIYNQHMEATPKSFAEIVDALSHRHEDSMLADFISNMVDSFYLRPPSPEKSFGACVTYSSGRFARSDAFSTFHKHFRNHLAEDMKCRQVRICAVGNLQEIAGMVRDTIWKKLLP
jgi:hypothetical protein